MNEVDVKGTLDWLYRMQKDTKINRDRAEARPGVTASELAALELKLQRLDYLIGITIEKL